jgi:hypothetical protein
MSFSGGRGRLSTASRFRSAAGNNKQNLRALPSQVRLFDPIYKRQSTIARQLYETGHDFDTCSSWRYSFRSASGSIWSSSRRGDQDVLFFLGGDRFRLYLDPTDRCSSLRAVRRRCCLHSEQECCGVRDAFRYRLEFLTAALGMPLQQGGSFWSILLFRRKKRNSRFSVWRCAYDPGNNKGAQLCTAPKRQRRAPWP